MQATVRTERLREPPSRPRTGAAAQDRAKEEVRRTSKTTNGGIGAANSAGQPTLGRLDVLVEIEVGELHTHVVRSIAWEEDRATPSATSK